MSIATKFLAIVTKTHINQPQLLLDFDSRHIQLIDWNISIYMNTNLVTTNTNTPKNDQSHSPQASGVSDPHKVESSFLTGEKKIRIDYGENIKFQYISNKLEHKTISYSSF